MKILARKFWAIVLIELAVSYEKKKGEKRREIIAEDLANHIPKIEEFLDLL